MSGHSKWAQIKRTKGVLDQKRGLLFSKLSKKISIAVKEGGSGDPTANYKLKAAIDYAKDQGVANDNPNRTTNNIKHIFSKHNGNMGAQGSVAWQFITKGQILIERDGEDLSDMELAAIDAGAEDVRESEEG